MKNKKKYRFAFMPEKETTPGDFLEYVDEIMEMVFEGETGDPEIVLQFADKKLDLTFCPEVVDHLRQAIIAEKEYQEEKMEKAWKFIKNLPFTEDKEDFEKDPDNMILVDSILDVRDAFYRDLEQGFAEEEDVYGFLDRHKINWK